ncbi:MAG: tetratricopeptide repeat protein [Muricauda sp.]|jgi:two-component sensor histidine kinase|nr:histidine kinase dimerization/phosphoacceptor domain -containing protein [Allomuricauda sp.]MBO6590037.1 tetratricopeptide repeat protein [Allomuricauda sp.]MBO6619815.1 tetratricopeptide repeat protein [Allomuricauda sp.]MBO6645558.1 tetratricopeptide repeat protein [Allomuricauda sp.]MBO6748153.1 tetratricopeptide repeat protein [Allomuricauda sp.]MBO6845801.1 tetratricopeptide repeat protein [Allomuricauda sp.]
MGRYVRFLFTSVYFAFLFTSFAQTNAENEDSVLEEFQDTGLASERFEVFFNSLDRYNVNSAYDWLDTIKIYLTNAEKTKDTTAIRLYKVMQAQVYNDLGEYDKSTVLAKELYDIKDSLDDTSQKVVLDVLDDNYANLQLFDKQIEIRKQKRELGITNNVAFYDIYSNLGLYRKARNQYIMEVKPTIADNDSYGLAKYHSKVGNYLRLDDSAPTALSELKKANSYLGVYMNDISTQKSEADIFESQLLQAEIEGNIAKCHVMLGEFEEAIPLLETSIETLKKSPNNNDHSEVVENTLFLAEANLQLERFREAKKHLDTEFDNITVLQTIKRNSLLAAFYDKVENYKNASIYYKRNERIKDSLAKKQSALIKQQLVTIVANEDLENSQRLIDEQKRINELARSEMKAKDERINLVFISLIFTLLGFAGLVYAYLKSIKNQRLIAEQKHIIENSLVEKDSLLKEIHHRVKNNLQMVSSLLSLQTKNTRSKAAIEALEEGKSRVKAMALIHQKLYQNDDLSVIEMQGYIESLINSVQSVYKKGGHNISITIDAEGTELDIDRAIPFGLILNELVSNSFKYAFPENDENGKIYIHLRKNGDQGYFEYTDNGVGLPEDSDERAHSSMGIRLINRLVNQLQSKLNIDRQVEGVRFWFNFS